MIFTQYYLDCLSQASYLIGDETTGRAVVVDPRRDVAEYLEDAAAAGLTIELIIETHFHADYRRSASSGRTTMRSLPSRPTSSWSS